MQHPSSTKPLLCRELVGREDELRELGEALQRAAGGRPQLVLQAGEAGVGKTKLCRAFIEVSQIYQARVLYGQAIPQDQALPFGPFLDAFRRHFTTTKRSALLADPSLDATLALLLRLLPELAPLFPDFTSAHPKGVDTAIQGQQAIFHGLLSVLQAMAQAGQGPLLLILDDLHWADATSLDLLAFLAHRLDVNVLSPTIYQPAPLLIVGTYRSEAVPDNAALGRLLGQLHSQRQAREVRLAPLSFPEYRRFVSSILEQTVPEEFAHFLFEWDEGNPFFSEELLSAMATSGQLQLHQQTWHLPPGTRLRLPPSLTTAILERFNRLPAADQEVLAYAAVIGRVFDFPLLAELCGLDERELVGALRRAVSAQLISEVSGVQPALSATQGLERYQFRHALTREVIYEQMLAPERRARHRAVAQTLERLYIGVPTPAADAAPVGHLDEVARLLAEHYWSAGLPEQARPYALHEAERAGRVFALREERYYLNVALAGLPEDSPERLHLLQRLGMVSVGLYEFADALHWFGQVRAAFERMGEHRQSLLVLANMLLPAWFLASPAVPDMLAELEAAAEADLADPDPSHRNVETLVVWSLIAMYPVLEFDNRRCTLWIERSLALFESLTDSRKYGAIQLGLISRGWVKSQQAAAVAEEGIAELRNVIDTARQFGLPDVALLAYNALASILICWGRSDEAGQVVEEVTEFEELTGLPRPFYTIGWLHYYYGERWEEGKELLRHDIERMERMHIPFQIAIEKTVLAHFLLTRNELSEARELLSAAQPTLESMNEYIHVSTVWWGLARLYAAQGNLLRAQQEYERLFSRWKVTDDKIWILPMLLDGVLVYTGIGNLARARAWLDELRTIVRETGNPVGEAASLEARGVVHAGEGALEQAIKEVRQAVEMWSRLRRHYERARASRRLAELLLAWARTPSARRRSAQSAREEAETLLRSAEMVYERLQIRCELEAVRALLSSTALEAQQKRRRTLATRYTWQGLTQRERQVLLQVAAGRTNQEIAAALGMSVSTVERHVTHILTKLGVKTRTQAATYAITHGWMTAQP